MSPRTLPLPQGELRGKHQISTHLIQETRSALLSFYKAGRYEGGHEGICYWAGRVKPHLTRLTTVIIPDAHHERFAVFVSAAAFGDVARRARAMGLGVLAQVHSHPRWDARHSDGDDELIVMPFENMLSLVAPHYGRTLTSIKNFSIHQFQDHRWVLCDAASISATFETVSVP